ncbi:CbtB-domain containing protein [Nocardia aobensis]
MSVDRAAASFFGTDMPVHESVHAARHFLGFACH